MSALDDAVRDAVHASAEQGRGTPGLVVTEYVLAAATSGWNEAGEEVSQVVLVPSGPNHRVIGLLVEALLRHVVVAAQSYEE